MRFATDLKASLLGLAFFVVGCDVQTATDVEVSSTDRSASSQVLPIGRYVETAEGAYKMGWPGSGVRLRTTSASVQIEITDAGTGFMDLVINGQSETLPLEAGRHWYNLFDDAPILRDVYLTRKSEFYDTGLFTLHGIKADSTVAYELSDRGILFLGDSITAGFGVAGNTRDCTNTPELHAPTQSYAMLAADGLNAESQLIAISGRGVVHNWDGNPAPVMPAQIDFALPDRPDTTWDHSQFTPDVVVTLLGTNDWSVIDPGRDKFRTGYLDMLSDLRERFPQAHIVTVSGPLLDGEQGAAIRDGIDWAMEELDDPEISTLDVQLSEFGLKWSCNAHPGRTSMKLMANDLMAHIQAQIGWSYTPIDMPPAIVAPDRFPEGGKAHFAKRVAEIAELPIMDGGTLLIGDSITEGWLWNPEHRVQLPGEVANHGIGWDTTDGLIARLPQILPNRPDRIFIKIGTNDISQGRRTDEIATDFDAALMALRGANPDAEIYVQSILPREAEKLSQIAAVNARYQTIAEEFGADYIDLTPYFAAADGALRPELTTDGLHLSAAGYQLWTKVLSTYLLE